MSVVDVVDAAETVVEAGDQVLERGDVVTQSAVVARQVRVDERVLDAQPHHLLFESCTNVIRFAPHFENNEHYLTTGKKLTI